MTDLDQQLSGLSAAEEFLDFFALEYDQAVVNVNRLHILKRFNQYLRRDGRAAGEPEEVRRQHYSALLKQAYEDFVSSNAAQEKVFKVFQDAAGQSVSLDSLKASMPGNR